jgi:alanyl-tRNA synthetase
MSDRNLTSRDLRNAFLAYFEGRDHLRVPSAPLVPREDPTLLFTNAGMVPFKRVFTGQEPPKAPRAVSAQKCVRAGGKHNDLENVGHTGRHHTFFEMLGNFSFGDYFKEEAIRLAWEFLTKTAGLAKDRLWVSVYKDDDEAYRIWRDQEGVPDARIVRRGEKDNFWQMGDTGPCGPCTEIHVDQGPEVGCGRPTCAVGCDDESCDRFLEVWNLVFMQYDRDAEGKLTPLPKPSIDTGMGLERLTAVCRGVTNNYDTDLFLPIIHAAAERSNVDYGEGRDGDTALRVLADHARAIAFLIADGVLPANDGRGYVLRRILRRAARYGRTIGMKGGMEGTFLAPLTQVVVERMGEDYPELVRARETIARITTGEEERFGHTLDAGLQRLEEMLDGATARGLAQLPGEDAFHLYDTYGFPVDLAGDVAKERGLSVDIAGFEAAMAAQRERARASWKGARKAAAQTRYAGVAERAGAVPFTGYERVQEETAVVGLLNAAGEVDAAQAGDEVEVVLAATPFYAESGGQVGDAGELVALGHGGTAVAVTDTQAPVEGLVVHKAKVVTGELRVGDRVTAAVDAARRKATARNHTATHLLHAVLREVLGEHVKQAGSLVAPDRLRFDFTHFAPLTARDLELIEERVNEEIRADFRVATELKDLDAAIASGAMALFGEKYAAEVRVVRIADVSTELCGGTHCAGVGEIGLFKIVSEGSVGAGVRRIEAVTGAGAIEWVHKLESSVKEIGNKVKVSSASVDLIYEGVLRAVSQLKEKDRQIEQLQRKLTEGGSAAGAEEVREVGGLKILTRRDDGLDANALRALSDRVRDRLGSGAALLASVADGRVLLITLVTKDATDRLHAGELMREAAATVGGKGGGRPDMAQGGGPDSGALDAAVAAFRARVEARLGAG